MARDIHEAIREACLWLPESEEFLSHGSPNFRVRGKTFATYSVNHHGDGRIALWLNAPPGSQELHVSAEPKFFFVPAYASTRLKEEGTNLRAKMIDDMRAFYSASTVFVTPKELAGANAVETSWRRLMDGSVSPREGLLHVWE